MPRPAFPTSLRQFQQQFPDEAACREYLETFRWPDGFRHNRRKTPMAAFYTLLGLGSARGPTPGRLIRRSSRDLATIPDQELTTISGVIRGKLWLNEDDTRTYLSAENEETGRVATLQAIQWVHRRNFAQALAHGSALWWMDLRGQGWPAARPIWGNLSGLRGLWEATPPRPLRPDIAVVIDEQSSLYLAGDNAVTAPFWLNCVTTSTAWARPWAITC
jgi:hypothetical protein